jgi:hypothetical protein
VFSASYPKCPREPKATEYSVLTSLSILEKTCP